VLDSYAKHLRPGAAESGAGNVALNVTAYSTYFGLADLGFGCPELGYFSLMEIAAIRLPFGLRIERDLAFNSLTSISIWSEWSRRTGSIITAQAKLAQAPHPLPPDFDPDMIGNGGSPR